MMHLVMQIREIFKKKTKENLIGKSIEVMTEKTNVTLTENGAQTLRTTGAHTVDLFAVIGALREADEDWILQLFLRAWAEDPLTALKILFYARDVRGGLGERRVFRVILSWLAKAKPDTVIRNLDNIPEYGRYDDLLVLLDTPCEKEMLRYIGEKLKEDLLAMEEGKEVSLLAKWLPSVNAANPETVQKAKRIAKGLGMQEKAYRKTLSALRAQLRILENNLREKDYSFDYEKQPSKALFKYRKVFIQQDASRYQDFLRRAGAGQAVLHTGTIMPYELVRAAQRYGISPEESCSLDTTWNALENYTDGRNALVVIDGSGSMFGFGNPRPGDVALSLGLYFAERNTGAFHNRFITFSKNPRMVEILGSDLVEKVRYCKNFNEVSNTNVQKVFELILDTAVELKLPQDALPETLYFISDMEFDICTADASMHNFDYAKRLFAAHGYKLPQMVFWNVQNRNMQQPVKKNESGVVLVSGCSPRVFSMAMNNEMDPETYMRKAVYTERYAKICI